MSNRGAVVIAVVFAATLLGCSYTPSLPPSSAPPQHPSATPSADVPPTALPLACAELLVADEMTDLGASITPRIDENHMAAELSAVALRQEQGDLACGWSDTAGLGSASLISGESSNGSTVVLRVQPMTETAIDATGRSGYTSVPGEHPTLVGACGDGLTYCDVIQQRGGYLVTLIVTSAELPTPETQPIALRLIEVVGARIDAAGPPRPPASAAMGADPTWVCRDETVLTVLASRGYAGAPSEDPVDPANPPTCRWSSSEPLGTSATVAILPGGSWAFSRLAAPPVGAFLALPADAGPHAVAGCDYGSCVALLTLGDDLVEIFVPEIDGDPQAWGATVSEVSSRG
jgi:hypothetical protein